MSNKLYAERDIEGLDEDGNFYFKHVMAMTAEGLHSKSDIAAELGYRDSKIVELQSRLERANEERNELAATVDALRDGLVDARKWIDERNHVCDKSKDFCDSLTLLIEGAEAPQQHLRDVQAEAGRAGFIAGVEARRVALLNDEQAAIKADQYAASVKAGEK